MKTYLYQSPGEMHKDSLRWISELEFIADEQKFMNDLLGEYFLKLSSEENFSTSNALIKRLSDHQNRSKNLLKKLQEHSNALIVLLDDIDQPDEETEFKAAHKMLREETDAYLHDFKQLKRDFFDIVTKIMKHDKQNRLLN